MIEIMKNSIDRFKRMSFCNFGTSPGYGDYKILLTQWSIPSCNVYSVISDWTEAPYLYLLLHEDKNQSC